MPQSDDLPQTGINGEPTPGAIRARPPTMSELVELKLLCRDARHSLEGVYGAIATLDLDESFENAAKTIDDAGRLIESISQFSQRALKRMDEGKRGRS
jgi:hypothetical protein